MKKLLTFVFLLTYFFSSSQNLTVNYNFPQKIVAAQNYTVNITISKLDIDVSAEYQQFIPNGLTATALETMNGTFVTEDNMIQILWHKLPKDSVLKISYFLKADTTITNNFETNGQFSYFVNNQRGAVKTKNTKTIVENKFIIKNLNTVNVVRDITLTDKNNITIKLTVNKKDLVGVGEIIEKIPDNYKVEVTANKLFTSNFKDGILDVKIAKMINTNKNYTIIYKLTKNTEVVELPTITGKFKYIEKTKNKETVILNGETIGFENLINQDDFIDKENVKTTNTKDNGEGEIQNFFND